MDRGERERRREGRKVRKIERKDKRPRDIVKKEKEQER